VIIKAKFEHNPFPNGMSTCHKFIRHSVSGLCETSFRRLKIKTDFPKTKVHKKVNRDYHISITVSLFVSP